MNTARRPALTRLAASTALALLFTGAMLTASLPSLAGATPQPMITEVQPLDGLLRISGFNFGGTASAITLGGRVLRVVAATATGVDAALPDLAPGSYLLTLTVGSAGSQRSDESWVTLGAVGPQGVAGAAGANGPQGPAGPAGATGQQGLAGPVGPQGIAGATGPAGARGLDGAPGAAGTPGPAGPQGPAGAQGPAGPQGPAGSGGTPSTSIVKVGHLWKPTDGTYGEARAECPAGSVVTGGVGDSVGYDWISSNPVGNAWVVRGPTPLFPDPMTTSLYATAVCLSTN